MPDAGQLTVWLKPRAVDQALLLPGQLHQPGAELTGFLASPATRSILMNETATRPPPDPVARRAGSL
jgi:hypothetical protein